jgi:hypothetical protein
MLAMYSHLDPNWEKSEHHDFLLDLLNLLDDFRIAARPLIDRVCADRSPQLRPISRTELDSWQAAVETVESTLEFAKGRNIIGDSVYNVFQQWAKDAAGELRAHALGSFR